MVDVTAAGGVLYRKNKDSVQVVLIHRNGVWDLPKGKIEKGESIEACARREVAEEVGIPKPAVQGFLVKTWHEYQKKGESYGKTTHWFAMSPVVETQFTPQKSEGITSVGWVNIDEAEQRVGYDNLEEVLSLFKDSLF